MAYIAPIIYDRDATGDDQYIMQDLGGGKVRLIPSPEEVREEGTSINKALMQPIVDALQKLNTDILPKYTLTYWKRRTVGGEYYIKETDAWADQSNYESMYSSSRIYKYMYFFRTSTGFDPSEGLSWQFTSATIQYASQINLNTATGDFSLQSPQTVTVHENSDTPSKLQQQFAGKYIKGIYPNEGRIFYVPNNCIVADDTWSSQGGWVYYTGYTQDTGIKQISSAYSQSIGEWELVSADDPNKYPDTSTVDGYEWVKLGRIDEYVLNTLSKLDTRLSALESLSTGI